MEKANKYFSIFSLVTLGIFSVQAILGHIAFGYGLGDIVYVPILWLITVVYLISFLAFRNKSNRLLIANICLIGPAIWILLSATIWRGTEYDWNGELFYPSKSTKEYYARTEMEWTAEKDSLLLLIEDDPERLDAMVSLSRQYVLLGDKENALKYVETAYLKGDTSRYTRSLLADRYEDNGMHEKAIEQYEQILRIDSTYTGAKFDLRRLKHKRSKRWLF